MGTFTHALLSSKSLAFHVITFYIANKSSFAPDLRESGKKIFFQFFNVILSRQLWHTSRRDWDNNRILPTLPVVYQQSTTLFVFKSPHCIFPLSHIFAIPWNSPIPTDAIRSWFSFLAIHSCRYLEPHVIVWATPCPKDCLSFSVLVRRLIFFSFFNQPLLLFNF